MVWKYSTSSTGAFYDGIRRIKDRTLKIKGADVISFTNGVPGAIYLAGKDKLYTISKLKKEYALMPKSQASDPKLTEASEAVTILGHKCFKYVSEPVDDVTTTFWITKDLPDINCNAIARMLPGNSCAGVEGIPLMIEVKMWNGSYSLQATEIKRKKLDKNLFQFRKDYKVKD